MRGKNPLEKLFFLIYLSEKSLITQHDKRNIGNALMNFFRKYKISYRLTFPKP